MQIFLFLFYATILPKIVYELYENQVIINQDVLNNLTNQSTLEVSEN